MSEWKEYKFSDIARFVSDKIDISLISEKEYISTDNMLPNFGGVCFAEKLPQSLKCNSFLENDILFSNIRTYFKKIWLATFNGGCSADVLVIRSKNQHIVLQQYLYLLICSPDFINFTITSSNGVKMPRGDKNAMLSYTFLIPPIKYQKLAINHYLLFNNKIQLNTQTNQTLETIAQAIFKHWFIDFAPVHAKAQALAEGKTAEQAELAAMASISGKTEAEITALAQTNPQAYQQLQQTAAAFPSEFVESELGLVPKGWEVKKIEQVIKKIPVGKKYSQKNTFPEGNIPVLDQGKSGIIGFHNDTAGVKANIQDPVIVFANHTCYMRLIHFDFSAIQNVFAFKGSNLNIYWVYLATLGKQEFVEYKGHFPDFLIKQIIVPPKELTEIFGKIVKDNFSKIALNLDANEKLAKTRDLLLPRLLNNNIVL